MWKKIEESDITLGLSVRMNEMIHSPFNTCLVIFIDKEKKFVNLGRPYAFADDCSNRMLLSFEPINYVSFDALINNYTRQDVFYAK